jgi:hypothetical protein
MKLNMKMTRLLISAFLVPALCALFLVATGCNGHDPKAAASVPEDPELKSLGTVEVTARLVEIPEGAIFERDLYHYAGILKYEVVDVYRGKLDKGAIIYVGHYDPWKPRSEAADKQVKNVGGHLQRFEAGKLHHMALETQMDDFYLGAIVDKYFGKRTDPAYWAVWTNPAD